MEDLGIDGNKMELQEIGWEVVDWIDLVVCFLLGDSPASEIYMPSFRNTLSVPSSKAGRFM